MSALCKHCLDDTTGPINQDCDHCKKGLRREDLIIISDLMVPIIQKLNLEMDIKTFYSEEGYFTARGQTTAYIVYEDTEVAKYIFEEISMLIGSVGTIVKSSKNKKKVIFYLRPYDTVYEFTQAKLYLYTSIMSKLNFLTGTHEFGMLRKKEKDTIR